MLRVDNVSYVWMGAPPGVGQVMNQTAFEYTSTRSTFTMNVNGEVELKAKFLSPVTPDDLMRSSLPYSYLEVEVRSTDGKIHDVQLYTDISAGKTSVLICENTSNALLRMGIRRPWSEGRVVIRCRRRQRQSCQLCSCCRAPTTGSRLSEEARNQDSVRHSNPNHSSTMEHAWS